MLRNKKDSISLWDYVEVFLFILLTVGPLPSAVRVILYLAIWLVDTILFEKNLNVEITTYTIILLILLIVGMLIDIRNVDYQTPYSISNFAFFIPFIFSLFYAKRFSYEKFVTIFCRVVVILSVISLVCFALPQEVVLKFPTIKYYQWRHYTILVYNTVSGWQAGTIANRNYGCASEPGAYQLILNLCLAFVFSKMQKLDKKNLFIIILLVVTIVTTSSTTGYIIMSFIILYYVFKKKNVWLFIACSIIIVAFLLSSFWGNQVIKMQSGNFENRFENSMYVIKNYWSELFGIGSTGYDKIYSSDTRIGSYDMYTNLYLRFGLFFIITFIVGLLKIRKIEFSVCLCVLLTLMTESVLGPIVVLLIYYADYSQTKPSLDKGRYL